MTIHLYLLNNANNTIHQTAFPGGTVVKNLPANAGDVRDTGSVPGSGRSPGEGNGNPLQYSSLAGQRSLAGYSLYGRRVRHD